MRPASGLPMTVPLFNALSFPPGYLALPVPSETVLALLNRIDDASQDWEEPAAVAALDPALAFAFLTAVPSTSGASGFDLRSRIAGIMEGLGPDLLRAWCLDRLAAHPAQGDAGCGLRDSLHGLFVAELAVHLAVELHQCGIQEAYAAGLLHDIGLLWYAHHGAGHAGLKSSCPEERALSAAEREHFGIGHAGLGGALAERCGLPAALVDAIHLHHCTPESIGDASPMARLVWLAEEVAGSRFEVSDHDLGVAARASGLDPSTLSGLRADVGRRLASLTKQYGIPTAGARSMGEGSPGAGEGGPGWQRDDPVAAASVSALARGALLAAGEVTCARLPPACRLLLDLGTPLMLEVDAASGQLIGLPDAQRPWAAQLRLGAPGPGSVLAQGAEGTGTSQWVSSGEGPERSAADWQLARRLGASGLLCEPWTSGGRHGVAVFGLPGGYRDDRIRAAARRGIVAAVALSHARRQHAHTVRRETERELRAGYREHYRRLAHEASNPLTVMKTCLAAIRERSGEGAGHDEAFALLDSELDRVARLVRDMAQPPEAPPEQGEGTVEVTGLLEDLRRLYADALFVRRGIGFELRVSGEPVRACIPRDALTQVLLNLFKNASEALQQGERFSVALIPAANVGGVRCVGIRLADNGGGVSPEAMAGLFQRSLTSKGGEHQGVGLILVGESLSRHGAWIVCESDPLTGTIFHVYIPLAEPIQA